MNTYKTYFDRQAISQSAHDRLMALGDNIKEDSRDGSCCRHDRRTVPLSLKKAVHWQKWGALAACAALILGLGVYGLGRPGPNIGPLPVADPTAPAVTQPAVDPTFAPDVSDADPVAPPENYGFLIHSPTTEERLNFYMMPALNFQEGINEPAASIALPDGCFYVELTLEDLQKVFWGPEGKTENSSADLPWVLGWDGYTVQIGARYDGNGDLWMLTVYGTKGLDTFELEITPGRLPPQCLADPGGESADVNGTEVTSYYHAFDWDGDGLTNHVCTSEFLVDGYGYRFCNVYTETGEEEYDVAEAAKFQNICFVMRAAQWTDSRCYFDHIAHTDDIPPWEETPFDTLAAAREQADFAPYLPQTAPVSWSEFYGCLSYQEGDHNYLFIRWNDGREDHLEVEVRLPEGDSNQGYVAADLTDPESWQGRSFVTLRAQDLSPEVVKALEQDPNEAGFRFWFHVLHENGVVVSYVVNGLTAEEVWAIVEPTL